MPTLHLALPALNALHKAWTSQHNRAKYQAFVDVLDVGLAKIEQYYDRTADSKAYMFAMHVWQTIILCDDIDISRSSQPCGKDGAYTTILGQ